MYHPHHLLQTIQRTTHIQNPEDSTSTSTTQYPVPGNKNASRRCIWRSLTLKWFTQLTNFRHARRCIWRSLTLKWNTQLTNFRHASDFSFQMQLDLMQSQPKNMAERGATCTHPAEMSAKNTHSEERDLATRTCLATASSLQCMKTSQAHKPYIFQTNPWHFRNVDTQATTFWRHRRPLARNVQTNQCVRKCQEIKLIWSKSRTRIVQYRARIVFFCVLNLNSQRPLSYSTCSQVPVLNSASIKPLATFGTPPPTLTWYHWNLLEGDGILIISSFDILGHTAVGTIRTNDNIHLISRDPSQKSKSESTMWKCVNSGWKQTSGAGKQDFCIISEIQWVCFLKHP